MEQRQASSTPCRHGYAFQGKAATKEGFVRADGVLAGVVGCVDRTDVGILGPQDTQTVTKAVYWCRKLHYTLNVMVDGAPVAAPHERHIYARGLAVRNALIAQFSRVTTAAPTNPTTAFTS
ncbi:hypothetical protein IscW_ISCW021507 [Ixodes scapularis]|uniref:Uncharacterized protein n=1 Tax=Ixodes scapularis TaxID=6945 RepID=B7Q968_IXOSC|nr:hypothetical protein IscW_ISCW021507 [Ixodes scapularis]|eukprot:XP_002412462.1 hypothetical protein IscW_ISCW021507 [Ixodes scapularis]